MKHPIVNPKSVVVKQLAILGSIDQRKKLDDHQFTIYGVMFGVGLHTHSNRWYY